MWEVSAVAFDGEYRDVKRVYWFGCMSTLDKAREFVEKIIAVNPTRKFVPPLGDDYRISYVWWTDDDITIYVTPRDYARYVVMERTSKNDLQPVYFCENRESAERMVGNVERYEMQEIIEDDPHAERNLVAF